MAHLLRFRPVVRTVALELPDGSTRKVKVTVNDARDTQHVEDHEGRTHGTARPAPVHVQFRQPSKQRRPLLLRNMGMPRIRQAFKREYQGGLWAPMHGSERPR